MRVNLTNQKGKKVVSMKLKYLKIKNDINKLPQGQMEKALLILKAGFDFINTVKGINELPMPKFQKGGFVQKD